MPSFRDTISARKGIMTVAGYLRNRWFKHAGSSLHRLYNHEIIKKIIEFRLLTPLF
jgi:hypothetical protein